MSRQLPALGYLRESLLSLFGSPGNVVDGFVRAEVVEGAGAVGFELISLPDTLLGFNASAGNDGKVSYSAQAAHGGTGEAAIFTSLKLVNVSDQSRALTLKAFREDGSALGTGQFVFQLPPHQTFQRTLGEIFGLGPPTGPALSGSLTVEANGPGIIGDVVFGDPATLRYAAALPLQSQPFSRAVFSQVANLTALDPARSMFTGLAFHNPGILPAEITVQVFSRLGQLKGMTTLNLAPGHRFSEVLAVWIPSTAGQVQGFVVVESTEPIVAQQLFGSPALNYLSAVPPTLME